MYQDYYTRPELYCNAKEETIESLEYNVVVDPSMLLSSNTSPSTYMMMSTLDTTPQQQQQETDDSWWSINNNNCDNSALSSPTELSLSHPSPSYSPYSDSISQPSPIDTSFEYYPQPNIDVVTPTCDYYYSYPPQPLVINTTTSCDDLCGCYATTTNNTTTPTSMSPQSVYEETPSPIGISPLPVIQPEIIPVPPQQQQQPVQQQRSNSISSAHSAHIPLGSNNHGNNNNNSLRPYPCYLCSRAFARKHDLQRHIRVHTGAKPYACLCCKKAFARTDALKRHLRMEEACRTSPEIQAMKCAGKRRYRNL